MVDYEPNHKTQLMSTFPQSASSWRFDGIFRVALHRRTVTTVTIGRSSAGERAMRRPSSEIEDATVELGPLPPSFS